MPAAWTIEDLAAKGYGADGRRTNPAVPVSAAATTRASASAPAQAAGSAAPSRKHAWPEEALQAAIVTALRPLLIPGARLLATNGELPGGKEQVRRAARRKAMGYVRGTADLLAVRPGAVVWLEAKVPPNKPTAEQADFAQWAMDCGHGWAVVTSVESARSVLGAWGFLAPTLPVVAGAGRMGVAL